MKIKDKYLTESNIKSIEKELDSIHTKYIRNVESVATKVYKTVLIPFLKKRNWTFISGMGTFWIGPKRKTTSYYADDHPDDKEYYEIEKILKLEIEGSNNRLYDFMPDYKQ